MLADKSVMSEQGCHRAPAASIMVTPSYPEYVLYNDGRCVNMDGSEVLASVVTNVSGTVKGSVRHVDLSHKTDPAPHPQPKADRGTFADEHKARQEEEEHEENVRISDAYWKERAEAKDWECIAPDLCVYRFCGTKLDEDPRRCPEYSP